MARDRPPVESVDRALRVIELLGQSGAGLTLEQLAGTSGIPKSSLHRTLAALKFRGFASQQEENGLYFLGAQLLSAAFGFYERLDVRAMVHPMLVRLRDEFNETVHMAVLDGGSVVYLDKVDCSHPVKMTSVIGGRNPAHGTAVGKALIAWRHPTDEAVRLWYRQHRPLQARTRKTITSEAGLVREMARIRDRGYATDMEESEVGVRCVALPILMGPVAPPAAVSVSTPRDRLPAARMKKIVPRFRAIVSEFIAPGSKVPAG
jgi:IclR family acetate operon transcriptional repressor